MTEEEMKKYDKVAFIMAGIAILTGIWAIWLGQAGLVFIGLVIMCSTYDIERILMKEKNKDDNSQAPK